jgi:hypothetical protein
VYWTTENEEGVVYEYDSKDHKDYVSVDHFKSIEEGRSGETEANNIGDEESPRSNKPYPCNLSTTTH